MLEFSFHPLAAMVSLLQDMARDFEILKPAINMILFTVFLQYSEEEEVGYYHCALPLHTFEL